MPRIYDSVDDPYDYCKKCFPSEAEAKKRHDKKGHIYGPLSAVINISYDAWHPSYDNEDCRCHDCEKPLDGSDDYRCK